MIYTLEQHKVKTEGDNFYIAPNATVLGQVELGAVSYTHLRAHET